VLAAFQGHLLCAVLPNGALLGLLRPRSCTLLLLLLLLLLLRLLLERGWCAAAANRWKAMESDGKRWKAMESDGKQPSDGKQ
jgi:hypothetical protein